MSLYTNMVHKIVKNCSDNLTSYCLIVQIINIAQILSIQRKKALRKVYELYR